MSGAWFSYIGLVHHRGSAVGSERPLVSIIVTVYERTTFIEAAIRNLLAQPFSNYEIIVSDDSNSEPIRKIVLMLGDDRIRYNPSISRKGLARNIADSIRGCRGTYVAILNDDDLWEANFLDTLLPPLEADHACVLAFSDHWIMDEDGVVDIRASEDNSRRWGRASLQAGRVGAVGKVVVLDKAVPLVMGSLFRKSAVDLDELTDEVGGASDYWLAILLATTGEPLWYVPVRTTRYRLHRRMETVRASATKREDELFLISRVISRGWFRDIDRNLRGRFAEISYAVAINKLQFRQVGAARSFAWAGLRSSFNVRCLAVLAASLLPILPYRLLFGPVPRN